MSEATDWSKPMAVNRAAQLMTMTRYLARKRLKDYMRDRGLRIQDFEASELAIASRAYLERHPELFSEAQVMLAKIYG
jgi:hypothetical protein